MTRRQVAVPVLNHVQVLDEEITPALAIAEKTAHVPERGRVQLSALGKEG